MAHIEDYVENGWDVSPSFIQRLRAFKEEGVANFPFEWRCILACEAGDIAGTYASIAGGLDSPNLVGYAAGVLSGLLYATKHVREDAKHQGISPSVKDIGAAVLSAEIGCTLAATAVPAVLGAVYGISPGEVQDFYSYLKDFGVRAGALIPAIPVGLAAMSVFTLPKKAEATRLVAEKGNLKKIASELKGKGYDVNHDDGTLSGQTPIATIQGSNSHIKIVEQAIPLSYGDRFNVENDSLYRVISPSGRYLEEARRSAHGLACDTFDSIGLEDHSHPERIGSHDLNHPNNHGEHNHNH